MTDASPPRRHRFRIVALIVLVILMGAFVGLRLWASDERLKTLTVELLSDQLLGRFDAGRVHWDFPDGLLVEDFEVSAPGGGRVLLVPRLSLELSLSALLSAEVRAESIDIDGITIDIREGPLGIDLIQAFTPKEVTPSEPSDEPFELPLAITVDALQVRNASVSLSLAELGLDIQLDRLDARVALRPALQGELGLDLKAPVVHVRSSSFPKAVPPFSVSLEKTTASLAKDGSIDADLGGLVVEGPGVRLDLTGGAELSSKLALVLRPSKAQLALDLGSAAWVESFLPMIGPLAGTLAIEAEAAGPLPSGFEARMRADGKALTVAGVSCETLAGRASLSPSGLSIEQLVLGWTAGDQLSIDGRVELFGEGAGTHALRARLERAPVRAVLAGLVDPDLLPKEVSGRLELQGRDLFSLDSSAAARLELSGLPPVLPRGLGTAAQLSADATLGLKAIRVEKLMLRLDSTRITGKGRVPISSDERWNVDLELEDAQPTRIVPDVPNVDGQLRATVGLRGPLAAPRIELDAGYAVRGGGRLEAKGRLTTAPRAELEAELVLDALRIDGLALGVATGTVSGHANIHGPLAALSGRGVLSSDGLRVAKIDLSEVTVPWSMDQGRLEVQDLLIRPRRGGQIGGAASLSFDSGAVSADVRAESLPTSLLEGVLDRELPVSGRVFVDARLGGTVKAPTYAADLRVKSGKAAGIDLGRVVGHIEGDLSAVDARLLVDGDVGRVRAKSHYPISSAKIEGSLSLERVDLGSLSAVFSPEFPLRGRLGAEIGVTGQLPRPQIQGRVDVRDLSIQDKTLGGGLSLRIATSTAPLPYLIEATLLDKLALVARVAPPPALAMEASAELSGLELSAFLPALSNTGIEVRVAGHAEAGYDRARGPRFDAALTQLDLESPHGGLRATRPLRARLVSKEIVIDGLILEGEAGRVEAEGRLGDKSKLSARGRIELALVAPWVAAISEAEGPVDFDARLGGTSDKPQIHAALRVSEPVRIRPRAFPQDITLERLKVEIEPTFVKVEELVGKLGDGELSAKGRVDLVDLSPARYDLELRGVGLPMRSSDLLLEANADLRLTGAGVLPNVGGTINVVRGRFLRKFRLKDLSLSSEVDTSAPLEETMPELANMGLDVKVISPSGIDVQVDAGSLRVLLSVVSDVRVRGNPIRPKLDGHVGIPMGSIEVPAGKLEIVSGGLDFAPTAAKGIDAELSLRAEGEITNRVDDKPYFVRMDLGGRLDEMLLNLSSDPYLEEREVLMLLLTGYGGVGSGEDSRAKDAALAMAGSQLVGPVADYLSAQIDRVFNLGVQFGAEVTSEGLRLTAKKDISRRLRIEGSYSGGTSDVSASASARARFFLLDRLFFETSLKQLYGSSTTGSDQQTDLEQKLELKLRVVGD